MKLSQKTLFWDGEYYAKRRGDWHANLLCFRGLAKYFTLPKVQPEEITVVLYDRPHADRVALENDQRKYQVRCRLTVDGESVEVYHDFLLWIREYLESRKCVYMELWY